MFSLNIPLHAKTRTRLSNNSRRVLWLAFIWMGLIFTAWFLASLWFGRDTLSSFAPEGTVLTLQLTPNTKQWPQLLKDFGSLSLVSDRPLNLNEIINYRPNELAVFFLSNGQTMVAIRTAEKNLPKEKLDLYGINFQKLTKNRWLLSENPLPFSSKKQTKFHLSSIWPKNLGTFSFKALPGIIYQEKTGYSVRFSNKSTGSFLPNLPSETIAATVVQAGLDINLSAFFEQLSSSLDPLKIINAAEIWQSLQKAETLILLAELQENTEKIDFLIEISISNEKITKILQAASVLQNPTTRPMVLPDGSLAKEMVAEPPENPAKIIINGYEVQKNGSENNLILALNKEKTTIIASNQTLLENYLVSSKKPVESTCGSKQNLAIVKPAKITNFLNNDRFFSNPVVGQILSKFSNFYLNSRGFNLCY